MPPLVEFEVFRDYLGVAADDPAADDVSRLLDAICVQVRRLARRDFEGDEGGSYTETIRIRGAEEFTLPHVPVLAIARIAPVTFAGVVGDDLETTDWRLEDAKRGLVRLRPRHEYVEAAWTTTGAIEGDIPQAVLDWGRDRWAGRDRVAGLISYTTGDDSETYAEALAGQPPRDALRAILGARHATGGGVV